MKTTSNVLVLALLCAYAAQAHAVYLYNRSGERLCAAGTRDEPEPFDHDVARITEGWICADDLGTLEIERSDGILDVAVRKVDGTDYVASSSLAFEKTNVFVPKDNDIKLFGMEILKLTRGPVVYSWRIGPDEQWSNYRSVHKVEDLPAALDALGFKPFEAWRLDAQHNGLGYTLN